MGARQREISGLCCGCCKLDLTCDGHDGTLVCSDLLLPPVPIQTKRISCPQCNRKFSTIKAMGQHALAKHKWRATPEASQ